MAVKTKTEIKNEINSLIADNTTNAIDASDIRTPLTDIVDTMSIGGDVPAKSTIVPYADSTTGSIGSSNQYATADHSHPRDSSKQDKLTAGTGIQINSSNIISATGGAGVQLSNNLPSSVSDFNSPGTGTTASRYDHQHQLTIKTINNETLLGSGNIVISSPTKSTSLPLMDGTASAGVSFSYSSADHRHPMDTNIPFASNSTPNPVWSSSGTAGGSSSFARGDHRHQLQLKTINNNSLFGSGNLVLSGEALNYYDWGKDQAVSYDIISNSFVIGKLASTRLMSMSYTVGNILSQTTLINNITIPLVNGYPWNAGLYYWVWELFVSSELGLEYLPPKQVGFYYLNSAPNSFIPFYGKFDKSNSGDEIIINGINNQPLLPANATAYIDMWLPCYDDNNNGTI